MVSSKNSALTMIFLFSQLLVVSAYLLFAIKSKPEVVVYPIFWFYVVYTLYYSVGPLIYFTGHVASLEAMNAYHAVNTASIKQTNLINSLFIMITTFVFLFFSGAILSNNNSFSLKDLISQENSTRYAVIMLVVGLPVKIFLYLPIMFGMIDADASKVVHFVSMFPSLSIIFLTISFGSFKYSRLLTFSVFVLEFLLGVLSLSKFLVLLPFISLIIGLAFCNKFKGIFFSAIVAILVYISIVPVVTQSRNFILNMSGNISDANYAQRVAIIGSVAIYGKESSDIEKIGWWTRLSYVNAQAFALEQYDKNLPGESLKYAALSFIPRVLWPDKPEISFLGRYFNTIATGSDSSASAPGFAAESYWNFGYSGVLILAFIFGLSISLFSLYSSIVIYSGGIVYLLVIFIGINIAIRVDGWIAMSYSAPLVMALLVHIFIKIITSIRFKT
ncbi:hypothetical protein [Vibrio breoganii]|nr:hypothetical protein [Vibrio breoganii]